MGRHFGDLAKVRHIITYSLSPFEQRAFPNYFSKGIPNVWRRFSTSFFKVAPRKLLHFFLGVDDMDKILYDCIYNTVIFLLTYCDLLITLIQKSYKSTISIRQSCSLSCTIAMACHYLPVFPHWDL